MFILLLLFLLQTEAFPTSTGPETEPTIAHTLIWGISARTSTSQSDIIERTLYQIIRSCLLTIIACVYRAIHQNVPDPKASWWARQARKLRIAIITVIAPETMLWWAMRQWFGARTIRDQVNGLKPELKWTLTHGQFAQMGGFGVREGLTERILYPPTLIDLLKSDRLDLTEVKRITKKQIDDRNKGDLLSKGVLVLQTTWFIFECLARFHQKLPVTKLEVATLAFAVLNIFTYILWWCKPLDVLCPIYFNLPLTSPVPEPTAIPETEAVDKVTGLHARPWVIKLKNRVVGMFHDGSWFIRILMVLILPILSILVLAFLTAWVAVYTAIMAIGFIGAAIGVMVFAGVRLITEDDVEDEAIVTYVSTFYAMKLSEENQRRAWLCSCFIGMIFGGIHFISWDSTFRTHTQLLLWRISSIAMVGVPFYLAMMQFFKFEKLANPENLGEGTTFVQRTLVVLNTVFGVIGLFISLDCLTLYVVARFSVLVLSFLTLRDLPPEALESAPWTTYFPHF